MSPAHSVIGSVQSAAKRAMSFLNIITVMDTDKKAIAVMDMILLSILVMRYITGSIVQPTV